MDLQWQYAHLPPPVAEFTLHNKPAKRCTRMQDHRPMHDFESLIFSLVGDNRCWSNKSANTYSLDPCNKSMGSLNRLQKPNPSPPQSTMEWTKLQSKTWHCRKAAWPSSFIRLIEEVNSRLHVPWLPLTPLIEVCYMANLQVHHFVIMDLVKFKTQRYRIRRPMLQHKS